MGGSECWCEWCVWKLKWRVSRYLDYLFSALAPAGRFEWTPANLIAMRRMQVMRGGIRRYDLIHLLYIAWCGVGNEFSYFFKNLVSGVRNLL